VSTGGMCVRSHVPVDAQIAALLTLRAMQGWRWGDMYRGEVGGGKGARTGVMSMIQQQTIPPTVQTKTLNCCYKMPPTRRSSLLVRL